MNLNNSEKNNLFFSLIIISFIFIISSNLAWINPDNRGAIKVLQIPLFWQYDVDAVLELGTATYFPEIFKELPVRITRPIYPFFANSFGKFFYYLSPIKLEFVYFVAFSYFLIKILIYTLSGISLIKICSYLKLNEIQTKLILLILFTNSILIKSLTTFHTTELQILLPILSTYLYILYLEKKMNIIIFSLSLGILFLSKNNYAIILTIFLHLLLLNNLRRSIYFLIIFFIPLLLWTIFYQKYLQVDYTLLNNSLEYNWFSSQLLNFNFLQKSIIESFITFIKSYLILFILIILCYKKFNYELFDKKYLVFIILFFLSTILQMIVTSKQNSIYMTKDLNFIYSIFMGMILYKLLKLIKFDFFKKKKFIYINIYFNIKLNYIPFKFSFNTSI